MISKAVRALFTENAGSIRTAILPGVTFVSRAKAALPVRDSSATKNDTSKALLMMPPQQDRNKQKAK
jgi:hypothetical protein